MSVKNILASLCFGTTLCVAAQEDVETDLYSNQDDSTQESGSHEESSSQTPGHPFADMQKRQDYANSGKVNQIRHDCVIYAFDNCCSSPAYSDANDSIFIIPGPDDYDTKSSYDEDNNPEINY